MYSRLTEEQKKQILSHYDWAISMRATPGHAAAIAGNDILHPKTCRQKADAWAAALAVVVFAGRCCR